jgi:hypothetical protein
MQVKVVIAFKLSIGIIIVILNHHENGLPTGAVLVSTTSGLKWKVKNRQLYTHSCEAEKKFDNETVSIGHMQFAEIDKVEISIANAKERSDRNEFEYIIEPIEHEEKTFEGEVLVIES